MVARAGQMLIVMQAGSDSWDLNPGGLAHMLLGYPVSAESLVLTNNKDIPQQP